MSSCRRGHVRVSRQKPGVQRRRSYSSSSRPWMMCSTSGRGNGPPASLACILDPPSWVNEFVGYKCCISKLCVKSKEIERLLQMNLGEGPSVAEQGQTMQHYRLITSCGLCSAKTNKQSRKHGISERNRHPGAKSEHAQHAVKDHGTRSSVQYAHCRYSQRRDRKHLPGTCQPCHFLFARALSKAMGSLGTYKLPDDGSVKGLVFDADGARICAACTRVDTRREEATWRPAFK